MNPRGAAWREERERREKELASDTLAAWQQLCSEAGQNVEIDKLIVLAATCGDTPGTADVGKLRRLGDAQLVHAALQLAKARRKAKGKLQDWEQVLADPQGVEMSSSTVVASYKARKYAKMQGRGQVLDVCCGVGGDAAELARQGVGVVAIDADAMRAAMCKANMRRAANHWEKFAGVVNPQHGQASRPPNDGSEVPSVQTLCLRAEDVLAQGLEAKAVHVDPSRRTAATRLTPSVRTSVHLTAWDELQPSHEVLGAVVERYTHVGIKQRAGLDLHTMPAWMPACETEIISEDGKLTQCMVWTGDLRSEEACDSRAAGAFRRATLLLPSREDDRVQEVLTLCEQESSPQIAHAPVSKYLYEPDDSIERAELLGELCSLLRESDASVGMPHTRAGLLTSDTLLASGWLRAFEVLAHEPYRAKTLAKRIAEFDAGHVEVKTRGKLVNPDELQPKLSKKGGTPLTLFVVRFGDEPQLIVTRRLS